jgi:hypothetical protein
LERRDDDDDSIIDEGQQPRGLRFASEFSMQPYQ